MKPTPICQGRIHEGGGSRTLTLGGVHYLHTGSNHDQVYESLTKKAIRSGEAIHYPDGTREFYEWVAVYDPKKSGSDGYVWKKGGGDICKYELVKTVVSKDSSVTKTVIRTAWRKLDLE